MFLAYLIPVVLFVLAYNKESKIITFLMLLYMWVLFGLNTFTPDYAEYERVYNDTNIWDTELGFKTICDICGKLGLSYQQFRMAFGFLYIVILYMGIRRNTVYANNVLAMFLLWSFIPGVSGIRFTFAVAVVINAIPFLADGHKISNIKYFIVIGIACLFHVGSALFFLYYFAKKRYTAKQYLLALLCILVVVVAIKSSLLEMIAYKLNIWKLIKWLSSSDTGVGRMNLVGYLCYSGVLIFNFVASTFIGNIAMNGLSTYGMDNILADSEKEIKKYSLYSNISFLSLFILPFYLISSEYQRYLFTTMLFNYFMYAGFLKNPQTIDIRNKYIYSAIFVLAVVATAAFYMYSQQSHDILATLVDNMLFSY